VIVWRSRYNTFDGSFGDLPYFSAAMEVWRGLRDLGRTYSTPQRGGGGGGSGGGLAMRRAEGRRLLALAAQLSSDIAVSWRRSRQLAGCPPYVAGAGANRTMGLSNCTRVEGLVDQYHPHARNDERAGMYLRVSEPCELWLSSLPACLPAWLPPPALSACLPVCLAVCLALRRAVWRRCGGADVALPLLLLLLLLLLLRGPGRAYAEMAHSGWMTDADVAAVYRYQQQHDSLMRLGVGGGVNVDNAMFGHTAYGLAAGLVSASMPEEFLLFLWTQSYHGCTRGT
jgi:hypothetical protein